LEERYSVMILVFFAMSLDSCVIRSSDDIVRVPATRCLNPASDQL
jgi:hypothetical protein